jgi:hypothetical protein
VDKEARPTMALVPQELADFGLFNGFSTMEKSG